MFKDKYKAIKFCIFANLFITLTSGINYVIYDVKIIGIAFVIAICVSIIQVVGYIIQKEMDDKNNNAR